ncbi:phosphate ABC transporter phosphate-binding protein, partial [Bacillaceae bacterium S4-13-56]
MSQFKKLGLILVLTALAMFTVACGQDTENAQGENESNNGSEENQSNNEGSAENNVDDSEENLEGTVIIDGSGTVYPLMAR